MLAMSTLRVIKMSNKNNSKLFKVMQVQPKENYHHGDLRNTLIKTATLLLAQHGVAGLSLRGVAKAAGVSHAAPYRHFRDKKDLLESIAVHGFNRLAKACEGAEKRYPESPQQQLSEAGVGYLSLVIKQPEIAHLMFSGILPQEECGEALSQASAIAVQNLARIVENGKRLGLYADRDTEDLTLTALACAHGIAMMILGGLIKRPKSKQQLQALGERISNTLLLGLLKR